MDKNVLSAVNYGPSGPMGPVKANTCAYSLLRKELLNGSVVKTKASKDDKKVTESASNTIVGTVSVQAPSKPINSSRPTVSEEASKVENKQESVHQPQHEYQQNNRKLKPQKRENNNNQENK